MRFQCVGAAAAYLACTLLPQRPGGPLALRGADALLLQEEEHKKEVESMQSEMKDLRAHITKLQNALAATQVISARGGVCGFYRAASVAMRKRRPGRP